MARKAKGHRADADTILLPHVSESVSQAEAEAASEEERRAREALESIERDLFGLGVSSRTPEAPAIPPSPAPVTEEDEEDEDEFEVRELPPLSATAADFGEDEQDLPPADGEEDAENEFKPKPLVESSGEDFSFLLGMDYEDELGNAIGFEKIRAYHERVMNGRTSTRSSRRAGKEFETQSQDMIFNRSYARQKTKRILHLAISLLLLLLSLIYERPQFMATQFGGPLDGALYPNAYILFGIQLLIFNAALSYRSLWEGFVRLVRFSPVDYSLSSVLVLGTLLYHFVLLFLPHETYPAIYLSPTALSLSLLSLMELLNWYRESLAFDVVSARRQKFAMVSRMSVGGKQGSAKERLLHDERYGNEWYVRPVGFVREYFSNTAKHMEHHRNLGTQLLLILSVGVAFGLFDFASGRSAEAVLLTVLVTVLLCAPATSLLLTALPMFFAAVLRLRKRGAIIGEKPISECKWPATLVLPDREVFASMEHEHFRLMEGCDAHRVSVLVRALLERVKSPLAEAFGVDVDSRLNPAQLTVTDIDRDGVSAEVGKQALRVRLGSVDYLAAHGIGVRGLAHDIPGSVYHRLLCVAVDDRVAALFLVRYRLADGVLPLIRELDKAGVKITIRTLDPCVRAQAMGYLIPHLTHPVEVMKPSLKEMEIRADRVDSTVVALGGCMEVARTYAVCRRISRVGAWGKWLQILMMLLGGALAGLLTLLGRAPSAFIITVWLLFWCTVYGGLSYLFLRNPSQKDEEEN